MADIWQKIGALLEAPRSKGPIGDLLGYVADRHGEHAADELRDYMQGHPLKDVQRHIALKYMDKSLDRLAAGLVHAAAPSQQSQPSAGRHSGPSPTARTSDKGTGPSEPIPTRPDRSPEAGAQLAKPTPAASAGGHAVGTAGRHVKPQSPMASTEFSPVVKPTHPGSFIGQHWQPAAYSAPEPSRKDPESGEVVEPGEIEVAKAALDKAKASGDKAEIDRANAKYQILLRRRGGLARRSIQHGSQATGNMVRGAVQQNPAKSGSAVLRRGREYVPWSQEHPGWWWAGPKHGWVSKSKLASLVASGEVKHRGA